MTGADEGSGPGEKDRVVCIYFGTVRRHSGRTDPTITRALLCAVGLEIGITAHIALLGTLHENLHNGTTEDNGQAWLNSFVLC